MFTRFAFREPAIPRVGITHGASVGGIRACQDRRYFQRKSVVLKVANIHLDKLCSKEFV